MNNSEMTGTADKPQPIATRRQINPKHVGQLESLGVAPWLAEVVAGRLESAKQYSADELEAIVRPSLKYLPAPTLLADSSAAAARLAKAVISGERIGVLTDYDVDGITSHAVIVNALQHWFGVPTDRIDSYIGHRLKDGYGVSQGLVDSILSNEKLPTVIITADCGSSDEARIGLLKAAGVDVIVTDHHAIPESGIPQSAYAVVNPTRKDCDYPDKSVAGVMVAFLLLCAVRIELIKLGHLSDSSDRLTRLLEFCSLGTIADAVSLLSPVNRAVVNAGLREINRLQRPCWRSLVELLAHDDPLIEVDDLGFQIGPRINARSRMSDPHAARRFLLADSLSAAQRELGLLDADNQQRKQVEKAMVITARSLAAEQAQTQQVLVVFDDSFYAGVQGIVASRLVDWYGKPAVVLSPSNLDGELSGSARSVAGIDIRQAMVDAAETVPVVRFGGHKAAAGLTLEKSQLDSYREALNHAVNKQLNGRLLVPEIETDGALDGELLTLDTWSQLEALQPFGRGWPRPTFEGEATVVTVKAVGADPVHLSLVLGVGGSRLRCIWFGALSEAGAEYPVDDGDQISFVYQLQKNSYRGHISLQLQVLYAQRVV